MQQEVRLLACFMYAERTGLILSSVQKPEDTSVFKGLLHHALSTTLPPPQQGIHLRSGHLMGKKSTEDLPYVYEEGNKNSFSALPENTKQLEDYLQWEETFKYLLRLLEGNENRNPQILKEELPWYTKNTWETDDNSSPKNMMEYLLQVKNMKENTPS
ncbi:PREDICTED: gastrin-releasing peptide [Crocodylus porosus]|uniref:gastrin-releasing peptide n=1 Tax=Crocodylus porosus TaxID=8502 RepID=UPI00093FEA58|nr:PREDICTED: gastrin-releasing peptide [Crocodylus porosus]